MDVENLVACFVRFTRKVRIDSPVRGVMETRADLRLTGR